ncbi:MAG: hypothetical protein BWY80_00621 [Firmicutes bacterium ADurb.Bin456]|nr:MAG: hypothetical protein BWY80_00621 [Firmicutes bacterium ADurb.Bin456]
MGFRFFHGQKAHHLQGQVHGDFSQFAGQTYDFVPVILGVDTGNLHMHPAVM